MQKDHANFDQTIKYSAEFVISPEFSHMVLYGTLVILEMVPTLL